MPDAIFAHPRLAPPYDAFDRPGHEWVFIGLTIARTVA